MSDWVTGCLRNYIDGFTARLQAGLAILASVGSTAPSSACSAPWGIYHALLAIGMSGQSTVDKVAGPIGEALIMTALAGRGHPGRAGLQRPGARQQAHPPASTALRMTCTPISSPAPASEHPTARWQRAAIKKGTDHGLWYPGRRR